MTAADLTPSELDIVQRLLSGKRAPEIARERYRSTKTVQHQLAMLRDRLGLRTNFQLGAWAERHGIREQGAIS